ncbi:MAG: nucleotide exchange factor GrpE [Bacteroidota bacterium]
MVKKSDKSEKQKDNELEVDPVLNGEQVQKEMLQDEADQENEETEEKEEIKEPTAEEKLADLQDRYLRLSAEYDNFRKRTLKEKIDLQKSANENLLNALLPVADDFDRAIKSVDDAKEIGALKEGFHLISGKFNAFLAQQGVKEIEAVNKAFDTDLHEAITKIPAPSKKMKGKVVDVVQKGYFLHEKVLRFAKVVIGE